jgi:hypothetical protein
MQSINYQNIELGSVKNRQYESENRGEGREQREQRRREGTARTEEKGGNRGEGRE